MRYQHFKGEANLRRPIPEPYVTAVVLLATTLVLALSHLAEATTVNANSASLSDVAAAIASAADGDTVTIPDGTATWTRTLQVRKAITLQGAGVGVTIKLGIQTAVYAEGRFLSVRTSPDAYNMFPISAGVRLGGR